MAITNYTAKQMIVCRNYFLSRLLQIQIRFRCITTDIFITRSFALILFVIQIPSKKYLKRFLGNREVGLYREENLIMKNYTNEILESEEDVTYLND